jgi:hypothetical protein
VPWTVSSHIDSFLGAAGDLLRSAPIENTVLLTEAEYLAGRPTGEPGQRFGWWSAEGGRGQVSAAFLQAPRHPPILTMAPAEALPSLVDVLAEAPAVGGAAVLGVDGRLVAGVVNAWRRRGVTLVECSRIRLYRLASLRRPPAPHGRARVATVADRPLLVDWFGQLMAQHPDDPSDLSYVVDDPIGYGGILLWEVDGQPRAMAGRSRVIAGMVRLGPVWSPYTQVLDGPAHAALVAACTAAAQIAQDVLVFASVADLSARDTYLALGFAPALDRVLLGRSSAL